MDLVTVIILHPQIRSSNRDPLVCPNTVTCPLVDSEVLVSPLLLVDGDVRSSVSSGFDVVGSTVLCVM